MRTTVNLSGCHHARRSSETKEIRCGRMMWRGVSTRSLEHLSKVKASAQTAIDFSEALGGKVTVDST